MNKRGGWKDQLKKMINPSNNEAASNSSKESGISSNSQYHISQAQASREDMESKYTEFKGKFLRGIEWVTTE